MPDVSAALPLARPWGLLTYSTDNVGDDIQSLAALRFLPAADVLLDRDLLPVAYPDARASIVLNGWWMYEPARLLRMRGRLDPLLISMHLSDRTARTAGLSVPELLRDSRIRRFLRRHGPVGGRDLATVGYLADAGLDAFFSGCLTLTLTPDPAALPTRGTSLLCIDVPRAQLARIRRQTKDGPVLMRTSTFARGLAPRERLLRAQHRLGEIGRARAVVTTRLHAALPALALGTPVLLVTDTQGDPRFEPYDTWVPSVGLADAVDAVGDRERTGWPAPTVQHLAQAQSLAARVTSWVAARTAAAAGDDECRSVADRPADTRPAAGDAVAEGGSADRRITSAAIAAAARRDAARLDAEADRDGRQYRRTLRMDLEDAARQRAVAVRDRLRAGRMG